jgi:hypothetical protein
MNSLLSEQRDRGGRREGGWEALALCLDEARERARALARMILPVIPALSRIPRPLVCCSWTAVVAVELRSSSAADEVTGQERRGRSSSEEEATPTPPTAHSEEKKKRQKTWQRSSGVCWVARHGLLSSALLSPAIFSGQSAAAGEERLIRGAMLKWLEETV